MKYDLDRITAIERTWLTPHWIPQKEFYGKANEDVNYLIAVIHEQRLQIAELQNHVRFRNDA